MASTIYVTHVEAMGPFLKVCGQTDRDLMTEIENTLRSMHLVLMTHRMQPELNEINSSDVYLVQVSADALFRRCHALHVARNGLVKVFLIDYGQEVEVHVSQMQLVIDSREGSMLLTIAPQVHYGVLAGVYINNLSGTLAAIRAQLGESMFVWKFEQRIDTINIITLLAKTGQPIIESLILHALAHPIALSEQAAEIHQYLANEKRHTQPHFAVDAFSPGSADGNVPPPTTRGLVPSRPLNTAPQYTAAACIPRHSSQQVTAAPPPTTRGLVPARPLKLITTHSHHDQMHDHISVSSSASSVSSTTSGRMPPRNLDYHPSIAIAAPPPTLLNGKMPPPTCTLPKTASPLPDLAAGGGASGTATGSCHMPTFNSNTLLVKSRHTVYVSYIEDGPSLFSVQLKSQEHELDQMMAALGNYPLQNLHSKPSLGMACVVRYHLDSNLYRAVIMNIRPTSCLVAYVDYGHTGDVPFASIYQIPGEFLRHQIFAMRFTLTGYQQLLPLSRDVERLFRSLVLDAELELIVRPLDGPPCVQYCELYTHRGQVNVLERLLALQSAHRHFAAAAPLREQEQVIIRCIESAKQFYVQPCHSLVAYEQMMQALQAYGKQQSSAPPKLAPVRVGETCMVWHKLNKEWNRAEVVELQADGDLSPQSEVIVQYVDIGSVDEAFPQELLQIPAEFLKLPRQAVECCLESFVNVVNVSKLTLDQMEMLADREDGQPRCFTVNLCASLGDGGRRALVVNLIDASVTPILDLSQRVFMMCMPPKQFRAYEQQRFQRMTNERSRSDEKAAESQANVAGQQQQAPFAADSQEAIVNSTQLDSPERSPEVQQPAESSSPIVSAAPTAANWRNAQSEGSWRQHHLQQQMEQQQARRANSEKAANSAEAAAVVDDRQQAKQPHKSKEMPPNAQIEEDPDSSGHFSQSTGSATSAPDTGAVNITSIAIDLTNTTPRPASISYWKSPFEFYVQPKDTHDAFVSMMKQLQHHYSTKAPALIEASAIVRGAYVVCRKSQTFFRAQLVQATASTALEVLFVDTGDRAPLQAKETWPLDRAFVQPQRQAIRCSLSEIVQTVDNQQIARQVQRYVGSGASVNTVFVGKQQSTAATATVDDQDNSCSVGEEPNTMWADMIVGERSLRQLLILDGMLMGTPEGVVLKCLVGQTVVIDVDQANGTPRFTGSVFGCKDGQMLVFDAKEAVDAGMKHVMARIDALNEENILEITALNARTQPPLVNGLLHAPLLTEQISVQVVQVDASNVLHLQNVVYADDGNRLLDEMFEEYETNGAAAANQLTGKLRTRQLCAGRSLEDDNWYRCVIERLTRDDPDGLVTVRYIDYGNCERLPTTRLCDLLPQFRRPDTLALKCYLALAATDTGTMAKVDGLTQGLALELSVLDYYGSHCIVDISCNGRSLVNVLRDLKLAEPVDLSSVRAQIDADVRRLLTIEEEPLKVAAVEKAAATPAVVEPSPAASAPPDVAPIVADAVEPPPTPAPICNIYENRIECYMSHTDRPDRFYLRRSADEAALEQMQENIQIVAASLPALEDFTVGTLCIVKYSGDDLWYRASIIDSGSGITSVQFIDYGNTDTLTQPGLIKAMNDAFRDIRPFAIACMLPLAINGAETRTEWPEEACQMLRALLEERLAFEYLTTGASSSVVSLWAPPDRDVSLQLVLAGFARPVPYIPNGQRAFVSHSNSLSDFYIQMESETNSLEIVADYLTNIDQFEPLQTFEANTICTARYDEDGGWYRARILSHSPEDGSAEVLFIDYGNTSTVREMRVLAANIAQLPHLSKHCTLQRPADVALWSDEAELRFGEIASSGETVFQVNLVMPSSRASTVQMLYAEEGSDVPSTDLSVELAKLCDKFCMAEVDQLNASVGSPAATAPASAGVLQAAVVFRASGPQDICVRLHSHREQLAAITKRLAEESGEWPTVRVLNAGDLCAARSALDGHYHRAVIAQISSDGDHLCDLFDEKLRVYASDLRVLPADLAAQSKCFEQYQIKADGAGGDGGAELTTGDECHVQLIDAGVQPPLVRLFADGQGEREIVRVRAAPMAEAVPHEANKCLAGYLTTIDSSAEFWAQLAGAVEQSVRIGQRMALMSEAASVQTVEVGQLYAAKFEDDGIFYRAKVTAVVENGSYEVMFIDYGNVAVATHLCELSADLVAIPPLATRCALSPVDESAQMSESLTESTFGELPMDPDSTFHFKVVETATPGGTTRVRMFRDAGLKLEICVFPDPIADGDAPSATVTSEDRPVVAAPFTAGTDFAAPISWTNSADDFFVQPDHLSDTLAQVAERLISAPAFGPLVAPKLGEMCVAQFVDDGVYYRARILAIDSEKSEYNVLFVDYGNDSIATNIRGLPEDLRHLDVCAVRCRLDAATDENRSAAITDQEFVDLVVAHDAEPMQFHVQQSLDDRVVVRMWTDGERKSEVVVAEVK